MEHKFYMDLKCHFSASSCFKAAWITRQYTRYKRNVNNNGTYKK